MQSQRDFAVHLPTPHARQSAFIDSGAKRRVVRAGRRSGKTVATAILSVRSFLAGTRVLYMAPTSEQCDRYWVEVTRALREPVAAGVFYKNETSRVIEFAGTEQRIKAKTAWNADSARGDYAGLLILDEWQLCDEDMWGLVGAPMLLDNNGAAVFIYTPPSLHSRSVSKARDPQHAARLFQRAQQDTTGRWQTFHFTSRDNPFISAAAIDELANDMTALAYRMEIMAEDVNEAPGALWTREALDSGRMLQAPELARVVVGVDPSITSTGDEAGIVTAGRACGDVGLCVLADDSQQGSPLEWARAAVTAYHRAHADCIVAESNQGGEMVALTIAQVDANVPVRLVHASRGKQTRAEPISAMYQKGRAHHIGIFPHLEDEMCLWIPGDPSPNRMDALVWVATELMQQFIEGPLGV